DKAPSAVTSRTMEPTRSPMDPSACCVSASQVRAPSSAYASAPMAVASGHDPAPATGPKPPSSFRQAGARDRNMIRLSALRHGTFVRRIRGAALGCEGISPEGSSLMPTATIVTNKGTFEVTLLPDHAPKTVEN